jgi:hypothetical protein
MNNRTVLSEVEWIETPKSKIVKRISQISPLIHPFTHPLINFFIQNEPNFIPNAPTKHENAANFTHIFSKKNTNFSKIIQKNPKISQKNAFCNFWTLTHLTPCKTKTYITFHPGIRNKTYAIRNTRLFMQNKPNSTNPGYKLKGPPKATQLNNQSSIINNQWKGEPNSPSRIEYQESCIEKMQNEPNLRNNKRKCCNDKVLRI